MASLLILASLFQLVSSRILYTETF
jgi:hypothetical protein